MSATITAGETLAEVCEVSIYALRETPENWTIYRTPDPAWKARLNAAVRQFVNENIGSILPGGLGIT